MVDISIFNDFHLYRSKKIPTEQTCVIQKITKHIKQNDGDIKIMA